MTKSWYIYIFIIFNNCKSVDKVLPQNVNRRAYSPFVFFVYSVDSEIRWWDYKPIYIYMMMKQCACLINASLCIIGWIYALNASFCLIVVQIQWKVILLSSKTLWRRRNNSLRIHYSDVIMSVMASQITSASIVCSTVCSGADQRKHQSSASLVFVIPLTKG